MKNTYVKPEMQVEEFLANQYVAACGQDVYGNYQFECNYPAGTELYFETNGQPGLQKEGSGSIICGKKEGDIEGWFIVPILHHHTGDCYEIKPDTKSNYTTYHPCNKTHTTTTMADFVDGYVNGQLVTVWTDGNSNFHATSHVGRDHWTTQKS